MHAGTWTNHAAKLAVMFVAAVAFIAATAVVARADDLRIALNQAAPIRLSSPAEGVAVGNASIAAVSVQDDQLIFVTGRSYGTTNVVVVGAGGRVLYSGRVVVTPDETNAVMVTRGGETSRLECTPLCRERPDGNDGVAAAGAN